MAFGSKSRERAHQAEMARLKAETAADKARSVNAQVATTRITTEADTASNVSANKSQARASRNQAIGGIGSEGVRAISENTQQRRKETFLREWRREDKEEAWKIAGLTGAGVLVAGAAVAAMVAAPLAVGVGLAVGAAALTAVGMKMLSNPKSGQGSRMEAVGG